jgi:hypothetical protein
MSSAQARRPSYSTPWPVLAVVGWSIVLLRLPNVVGHKSILDPAICLVFLLCIAWTLQQQPRGTFSRVPMRALYLYVAVIAVTLLRGVIAGTVHPPRSALFQGFAFFLIPTLGITFLTSARSPTARRERLAAIALAPGLYALANALLQLAGVREVNFDPRLQGIATVETSSLLEIIHITTHRIQLPLASGVNTAGIVAGAGLAGALVLITRRGAPAWMTWPCVAGSLYCLAVVDSRTALILGLVAGVYFVVSRRVGASKWIPVAVPLLPVLTMVAIALLDGPFGSVLSRGNNNDFATGNSRLVIWEAAWNRLSHPAVEQLYGWGANGHITSGLSEHYFFLFASQPNPLAYTTHNLVFQTIFDSGYLGLGVLVVIVWLTTKRLVDQLVLDPSSLAAAPMAVLTVILLAGATEASPTYASEETLIPILLVMGAAAGLALRKSAKSDPDPVKDTANEMPAPPAAHAHSVPAFGRA